ncbi:iron-sulfur cluster assembly scaffold protein [Mesomycoplasma hyorhinis]|uniref:iron-sulfur cluster assembly scaffold protein n=1 Tax=Mesomycoplasma hyorhinis TaxID=2100 RepID=UPI001C045BBE|nr:iron-sulfur cluster assembly scaffold protein [Mesomycoplasma hyorhinis]UVT33990.1 iron-sulfur cluster assembly scaffold protein [Mesomycoplasma hyorhinis]
MYNDFNYRRKKILETYSNPKNKVQELNPNWKTINSFSTSCDDNLDLALKIKENAVEDGQFRARGCSLFIASSDILLKQIKNKTFEQIQQLCVDYEQMLDTQQINKKLNDLNVFVNTKNHLNRLECVKLAKNAIKKIIEEN